MVEVVEHSRNQEITHVSGTQPLPVEQTRLITKPKHVEKMAEVVVRMLKIPSVPEDRPKVVFEISQIKSVVINDYLRQCPLQRGKRVAHGASFLAWPII